MKPAPCLIAAAVALCAAQAASADPFAVLRSAYAARDADQAASAYTPDAEVVYRYDGSPAERHVGRAAIAASFRALFDQIDPAQRLDLDFRTVERRDGGHAGVYRLRIGPASAVYGRFAVQLAPGGAFVGDLSTSATAADFEEAAGPVMLAPADDTLDRDYYARLAGRYRLPDGCDLVVTRSSVRLFARNVCTNTWRGLTRRAGRVWTAGDRVLSDKVAVTYRFAPFTPSGSPAVELSDDGGVRTAVRRTPYRTREVAFTAADGVRLTGTLYTPTGLSRRRPATVMLHGSGSQDRDGYASIIAVLADQLAAGGRVVLAYDKRGSGGSAGDGARAGFDRLADDAKAAMAFVAARPEVDSARIGLAGSSQAGWVAARAIVRDAKPADVLLLGAAGAALTVAEQNLYNTATRMRCAGIDAADIRLALDQQRAFFDHLRDPARAGALDALTERAARRPGLAAWLFPDSRTTDRTAGAWYVVLDPAFDPLPVWRGYRGRASFLFAEHDDATPTTIATSRLRGSKVQVRTVAGAQHLGLLARDVCQAELGDTEAFAPAIMGGIADFARR